MLKGYMTIEEGNELMKYIQEKHSFLSGKGKRIKYVEPIYDTRTGHIFCVKLRLSGEGKVFSLTNENKDKILTDWIYDWLENGSWKD